MANDFNSEPCNGLHDLPIAEPDYGTAKDWHTYARAKGREWAQRVMADKPSTVPIPETPEALAREMHARMALLETKLAKCEEYLELILEQLTK